MVLCRVFVVLICLVYFPGLAQLHAEEANIAEAENVRLDNVRLDNVRLDNVSLDKAVQLQVSFSHAPRQSGRVVGSSPETLPGLSVMNGETISFYREKETSKGVRTWYASVGRREDHQSVSVTPMLEAGMVRLQVEYDVQKSAERTRVSSTVTGKVGEWIGVLSPSRQRGKTYRSNADSNSLSVRVDLAL